MKPTDHTHNERAAHTALEAQAAQRDADLAKLGTRRHLAVTRPTKPTRPTKAQHAAFCRAILDVFI